MPSVLAAYISGITLGRTVFISDNKIVSYHQPSCSSTCFQPLCCIWALPNRLWIGSSGYAARLHRCREHKNSSCSHGQTQKIVRCWWVPCTRIRKTLHTANKEAAAERCVFPPKRRRHLFYGNPRVTNRRPNPKPHELGKVRLSANFPDFGLVP